MEEATVVVMGLVEVEEGVTAFFDEFVKKCPCGRLIFIASGEHDFAEDTTN